MKNIFLFLILLNNIYSGADIEDNTEYKNIREIEDKICKIENKCFLCEKSLKEFENELETEKEEIEANYDKLLDKQIKLHSQELEAQQKVFDSIFYTLGSVVGIVTGFLFIVGFFGIPIYIRNVVTKKIEETTEDEINIIVVNKFNALMDNQALDEQDNETEANRI